MYPPKHHEEYRTGHIKKVAISYPFATIISAKDKQPFITHSPLILHDNTLIGHIDAQNPQCQLLKDGYPVTAIFYGPQTYISPSIYTTKQLPTWNYVIAHAYGTVTTVADVDSIKKSIVTMTDFLEAPDQKFILDFDDPRMDRLVPYIHCFTITVDTWEGKFKLSQDKKPVDIEHAKQELIKNNQKNIAEFVDGLFN